MFRYPGRLLPRFAQDRIGSGSGTDTGTLGYESRDLVPDPDTFLANYHSIFKKKTTKQTNEKHGSLVVSAHTGLSC